MPSCPFLVSWLIFCINGDTYADTNYPIHVVDKVFFDNWEHFPRRERQPWKIQAAFYMALMFINLYPHAAQTSRVLSCGTGDYYVDCNEDFFRRWVVPVLVQLGTHINYIDYGRRLCYYNHVPLLPNCFTVVLDTYPVCVWQPLDKYLAGGLYQPKYATTVYKFQLGVTFAGEVVYASGPHLGTSSDVNIFRWWGPEREPWEWWLADGAYIGLQNVLCKFKNYANRVMRLWMFEINVMIDHYRARVEHYVKEVKHPAMFQTNFRGSYAMLKASVRITLHMVALKLKTVMDSDGPRNEVCGPWPHRPM